MSGCNASRPPVVCASSLQGLGAHGGHETHCVAEAGSDCRSVCHNPRRRLLGRFNATQFVETIKQFSALRIIRVLPKDDYWPDLGKDLRPDTWFLRPTLQGEFTNPV